MITLFIIGAIVAFAFSRLLRRPKRTPSEDYWFTLGFDEGYQHATDSPGRGSARQPEGPSPAWIDAEERGYGQADADVESAYDDGFLNRLGIDPRSAR